MLELKITHIYPKLLNLYGDRGNIAVLVNRCKWRDIKIEVCNHNLDDKLDLKDTDILFLGGGSDREQLIVCNKLKKEKNKIEEYINSMGVMSAICGGYQLLGKFYQTENEKIEGLSLLDISTVSKKSRLIGNIAIECELGGKKHIIVGFENHAGRTNIGQNKPLGKVIKGHGNCDDGFEGVIYKNVIGTYMHGPLLPKNPVLADFLIENALKRKYPNFEKLIPLNDELENFAREEIYKRMFK